VRGRSGADVWTVYIGKQRTRVKVHCAQPKREGPGLSGKGPGLSGKGLGRSGRSAACLCVERAVDARHVCEHLPQRPEAALRPARLSVPLFRIIRTRIPDYPYPQRDHPHPCCDPSLTSLWRCAFRCVSSSIANSSSSLRARGAESRRGIGRG
jgi:hypothetical protein